MKSYDVIALGEFLKVMDVVLEAAALRLPLTGFFDSVLSTRVVASRSSLLIFSARLRLWVSICFQKEH
jgi:hypothetical protein